MTENMTALPARCNNNYKDALKRLARTKQTTVGDLVRVALDEKYGNEIAPLLSFFSANDVDYNQQKNTPITVKSKKPEKVG